LTLKARVKDLACKVEATDFCLDLKHTSRLRTDVSDCGAVTLSDCGAVTLSVSTAELLIIIN